MAVTVVLELHLKPEGVADTLSDLERQLPDTRAYDGCLSVETFVDQDDPCHVVLIERWREKADQERYLAWRAETGSLGATVERSVGPPTITFLDLRPEL
jgi:quinol monooxygenase YgiN